MCVAIGLTFLLAFAVGSPQNRYRQSVEFTTASIAADLHTSGITSEEVTIAITKKNNVDYNNLDNSSLESDYKGKNSQHVGLSECILSKNLLVR